METSTEINELATALAKAQGVMGGALKDSANPFFKSKYADLESVWNACRKALSENGLAVVQTTAGIENGVTVTTMLVHSSGQWVRDTLPLYPKDVSPQGMGSAITYGRRYALAAIAGVYQTDDDGEAAHGRHTQPQGLQPQLIASNLIAALEPHKDDPDDEELATAAAGERVRKLHVEYNLSHQEAYRAAWELIPSDKRTSIKTLIGMRPTPRAAPNGRVRG